MTTSADHAVARTLATARAESVEFPHLLANHAPMVLIALQQLGASPERLAAWYATYRHVRGLKPMPEPIAPISIDNWQDALGRRDREADYRRFFTGEAERLGIDKVVRYYLPALVTGIAASALHPSMRLAYALVARDADEVGTALGYWAACHLPLPAPRGAPPDTDDPGTVLAAVRDVAGIRDLHPETDLLWHTIRAVGELPDFAPLVDRLAFGPRTPERMARTALALYATTMDFSALHAVTGLHWVRLAAAHLDDPEPLYRCFWQVVATLVPKIGFPSLPSADMLEAMRREPAPDWRDIASAAVASDDEHDISLVFSAWQEEAVWQDPLYRVVAARRVGLVDAAANAA